MKICVVGLGSMGKRRIRLLQSIDPGLAIAGVDVSEERRTSAQDMFGIETYPTLNEALQHGVSVVFVCTAPISHAELIEEALNGDCHVFSEINLISAGYEQNIKLAETKNRILFLSSTPLYREEIGYIVENATANLPLVSYSYHVGQYLPDWHPWESFKNYFIGDKRTNGCREIMAIELPWITRAFGDIVQVTTTKSNITNLEIDYPDSYHMILAHDSGVVGSFVVDIASRKACRDLSIQGQELHIEWDGRPDGLYEYDFDACQMRNVQLYQSIERLEGYNSTITEDAYRAEILNFFDVIAGKGTSKYSFAADKKVLSVIDEIEGVQQ